MTEMIDVLGEGDGFETGSRGSALGPSEFSQTDSTLMAVDLARAIGISRTTRAR
jgi:hypothetical protein